MGLGLIYQFCKLENSMQIQCYESEPTPELLAFANSSSVRFFFNFPLNTLKKNLKMLTKFVPNLVITWNTSLFADVQ